MLKNWGERLGAPPSFSPVSDIPSHGRAHAGGPGAARFCVILSDRDGALKTLPASALGLFRAADTAGHLTQLFLPEERARLAAALAAPDVDRVTARARIKSPDHVRKGEIATDIGFFELSFERRANGDVAILIADRTAEDAARRALEKEAAAAAAEAKAGARLLADLSHEMKTPLNAVIGFADAMREETFGPIGNRKYEEYAGHIGASGRHLLDLVTSILDLARLEADRLSLKPVICKPADIIAECAAMVRLAADDAGLGLTLEIEPGIGECLLDPRALRQIVLNLLSNAVKFTSDGAITVRAHADGDTLLMTVEDTGIGMSADELNALGARFTKAQGAGVRGADGAGLGLSLAFALAERHGGTLDLASAPGEGVRATVRLPLNRPRAAKDETRRPPEPPRIQSQLERVEAYRREVAQTRASAMTPQSASADAA